MSEGLRKRMEEIKKRAIAEGKWIHNPNHPSVIVIGAHAALQRAAELRTQEEGLVALDKPPSDGVAPKLEDDLP